MNVKMRNIKNIKKTMQIKDNANQRFACAEIEDFEHLRVPKSKISSMWNNEDAVAIFGNLGMPMSWMGCGWLLEMFTGLIFGNLGKLCLICFPT